MEIYARSWLPSVFTLFIFTLQLVRLGIESLRRSSPFFSSVMKSFFRS